MDLNLRKIGLGAASEKFEQELIKVINNISDPNTEAIKTRKVILEFEITPTSEDRQLCTCIITGKSKLEANKPFMAAIAVGIDPTTGEVAAEDHTPEQRELFGEQTPKGTRKVRSIN